MPFKTAAITFLGQYQPELPFAARALGLGPAYGDVGVTKFRSTGRVGRRPLRFKAFSLHDEVWQR